MPTYSRQDRLAAIQKAGFANPLTALSVSLAEFGENREITAQSQSDYVAGGVREPSFGPWQIHLPSHPDVTQSCAMDLNCSTAYAAKLSKGGTDFSPWSAFTNGSYKTFLTEISTSLGSPSSPSGGGASLDPGGSSAGPTPCNLSSQQKGSAISFAGAGMSYDDIASRIGAEVRCVTELFGAELPSPAQQGADAVGAAAKKITDPLNGLAAAIKGIQDSFRSENLWRAGAIVVGIGAVWVGGRLYLREETGVSNAG